jgi:choline dehydrogenase
MIHTDLLAKLLGVLEAIQARAATPTRLSLGAAASVVALTIVLRYLTAKQPKLITDYAKVAKKVNDNGVESDAWDFIIVGGGMSHSMFHTGSPISHTPNASRYSRMCSSITSLRRPKPESSTHRSWWKVGIFEGFVCF